MEIAKLRNGLFFSLVSLHLLALSLNIEQVGKGTKVLLLPALVFLFWHSLVQLPSRKILLWALVFCWLGDTILLFPTYFLGGLVAFLIGHLLYIRLLFPSKKIHPFGSILLILYGTGMAYWLGVHLDVALRIPVFAYLFVITNMGILAIGQKGTESKQFWLALGGILFILSDSFLAWNKFIEPFVGSGIAVMSTYIAAQYSLVKGFSTS